ncbi:MAG: energy-coupling factor transporter transmembrane protein EcfT [Eggerthellaceae bacterium]|nr:energy-coupling factor transporter transmembrane protein EcfT [Eggerthellaceae bacterium]
MNGFLEYVPGNSLLHRLNPVAKLLFAILFAIACFCTSNLVYMCVMLAIGLAMAASCGMMKQTFGLMKAVFVFSLILAILLIFTTPRGDVLVELPWGYIGTGSILAAVTTIVRLEAAAIPLFLTFYVTKISDLSNSVVKVLHVPYKYAFTFASTVHFIPVFMNDMKGIMEAQTARGVEFDVGGIVNKVRLMVPLCVPLLVSSVRKTNSAAIAAEVRGFNLRTRESGYKQYPFSGADLAVMILAVALIAIGIVLGVLF